MTAARMARNCSAGVIPSGPVSLTPFFNLPLQAGDAHHEELVDVGADERQKHQALEYRIAAVLRFLQHPPLKVHQAQLTVDVECGIVERSRSAARRHGYASRKRRLPGQIYVELWQGVSLADVLIGMFSHRDRCSL